MAEIQVSTGGGGYRVHIGQGVIERDLARGISRMSPGGVTVVSHPSIYAKHGRRLQDALEAALKHREDISLYLFPEGEENKCLKNLEKGYRAMLKSGVNREHILVCFGGGVVGDLAGFLAATYMRGMRYVQAPTTLMAMVDSAIGGKVGVDLPGAKNAVGAFYQPQAVYSDIDLLDTLPERELRSGLTEVVKYGFLFDEKLLESVEAWGGEIPARGRDLGEIIDTCVAHKARVVSADERDLSGERALLNYGVLRLRRDASR